MTGRLRFWLALGALWLLPGVAGWTVPAVAQSAAPQRLVRELAVTDERIQSAAALLRSTPRRDAEQALTRARALQAEARDALARSAPPRRVAGLTLRARTLADRSIAMLRGMPDDDRVNGQIERTRGVLDRARGRVRECADGAARDLLREAEDVQRRAEAAAAERRPLAALQLTFAARERAQEAVRRCGGAGTSDARDAARRALETTDDLLERARATPGAGSGRAAPLISRATTLQEQARGAYQAERFPAALRLATDAGALARRAARLGGTP
jgi:hypothetical protein